VDVAVDVEDDGVVDAAASMTTGGDENLLAVARLLKPHGFGVQPVVAVEEDEAAGAAAAAAATMMTAPGSGGGGRKSVRIRVEAAESVLGVVGEAAAGGAGGGGDGSGSESDTSSGSAGGGNSDGGAPGRLSLGSASSLDSAGGGSVAGSEGFMTPSAGGDGVRAFSSRAGDTPTTFALLPTERLMMVVPCKHVTRERVVPGVCRITGLHVVFEPAPSALVPPPPPPTSPGSTASAPASSGPSIPWTPPPAVRWAVALLVRMLPRRYLLQPSALEFFFSDGATAFLSFSVEAVVRVFKAVWEVAPPRLLAAPHSLQPARLLERSRLTERWVAREISNFEYIMELNTLAGRTFNDLTQYPVFPWVIADYTSPVLALDDPATYRDLSKPVGALNAARLEAFRERMEAMEGSDIPPFMYGTHYSNAGFVLFYLLRLEPFTHMHVELQGGHFDCPDRLFFSIAECWRGVTHSMTDVKELVPEWYTTPEMFLNGRSLPLGELQDGAGVVGDVVLPPWARTAHEFVWANRAALESEYVSAHLHEWVDLVFGCKQRGAAARDADNLFYYLTYEAAVALEEIEDPVLRAATESQIINFGQTPSQLLRRPHPPRAPFAEAPQPLFSFDLPLRHHPGHAALPSGRAKYSRSRSLRLADAATGTSGGAACGAACGGAATSSAASASPSAAAAAAGVTVANLADFTGGGGASVAAPPPHAAASPTVPVVSLADFAGTGAPAPTTAASGAVAPASTPPPPPPPPSASSSSPALSSPAAAAAGRGGDAVGPSLLTEHGVSIHTALLHPGNSAQAAALAASVRATLAAYAAASGGKAMLDAAAVAARPVVLNGRACSTPRTQALCHLAVVGGRALACYGDASVALHKWAATQSYDGLPYDIKGEKLRPLPDADLSVFSHTSGNLTFSPHPDDILYGAGSAAVVGDLFFKTNPATVAPSSCFAVVVPGSQEGGRAGGLAPEAVLVTCGYMDGGLRLTSLGAKPRADAWVPRGHRMADVTCVAVADDQHSLVTGHADGSVHVWLVMRDAVDEWPIAVAAVGAAAADAHAAALLPNTLTSAAVPMFKGVNNEVLAVHVGCLLGHRAPITAVCASRLLDVVVSGALDGTLVISSLTKCKALRILPATTTILAPPKPTPATAAAGGAGGSGTSARPSPAPTPVGVEATPGGGAAAAAASGGGGGAAPPAGAPPGPPGGGAGGGGPGWWPPPPAAAAAAPRPPPATRPPAAIHRQCGRAGRRGAAILPLRRR